MFLEDEHEKKRIKFKKINLYYLKKESIGLQIVNLCFLFILLRK